MAKVHANLREAAERWLTVAHEDALARDNVGPFNESIEWTTEDPADATQSSLAKLDRKSGEAQMLKLKVPQSCREVLDHQV